MRNSEKVIDLHCDTLLKAFESERGASSLFKNNWDLDIERMKGSGYWMQFFACFIELDKQITTEMADRGFEKALRMLDVFEEACRLCPDSLKKITSWKDAEEIKIGNQIGGILTVEETGIINGNMERIDQLYDKGVRLMTVMWNFENCMGYPNSKSAEIMGKGLKPFGIEAVKYMEEKGILVDVSHMNDGGFMDVVKHTRKPFVASHSNCRAVNSHERNLTDEMLKIMGNRGCVAGINFYPRFLGEGEHAGDIEAILRHIRHMVQVAGIDTVAIGTDFDGFDGGCEINSATEMQKLPEALERDGYTYDEIDKIMYGNAERIIKEI